MTFNLSTPQDKLDEAADNHPDEIIETATELASGWDGQNYGYNPSGCAAAALYAAYRSEYPLSAAGDAYPKQDAIADEFETSTTTIRKRLKDLREVAHE